MENVPGRRKRTVRLLALALVISAFVGIMYWQVAKYRLVHHKLTTAITENSAGLYRFSYQHLVVDEIGGNLSVENVRITTDTAIYEQQVKSGRARPLRIDITIPRLVVTGVKTPKALLTKEIEGRVIEIQSAVIELSPDEDKEEKDQNANLPAEIIQSLGSLQSIKADSLVLRNITFRLRDPKSGRRKFESTGFSAILTDIVVDSAHRNDSSRILFAREIGIHCNEFQLQSKDRQYRYVFSGLDYNSHINHLAISKIRVEPRLSEAAFAAAYQYSRDRLDFSIENITIDDINRFALFNRRLVAESLEIDNGVFRIYRDISHPHDSIDRTNAYPQMALIRLPLQIHIPRLTLEHGYIEYKEKNARSDSSGKLQFFDVHAVFTHVTNIASEIKKNNRLGLDFRSRFLNKGLFHANLTMLLGDPQGRFTLDASLGPMNATWLNPMVEPMALAKIDHGEIKKLNYHLDADKIRGRGKLIFLYDNVKVVLLKKDEEKNKYVTKVLPTLAASLLMKKSNPLNGEARTSTVNFERDRHRSIFHLMWKSMFEGVKQTAGMK